MKVIQAYRFTLDPTRAQDATLRSHAGAARFAWNWGLARCKERYAAERRWYTAPELHKLWNAVKKADPALAWWPENSKCAYQEAFRDLDRALTDFINSKKDERKGRRLGFPKFKKRGRCRDSFRLSAEPMRCTGTTATLPKLGTIHTHESTRKLTRRLEAGTARILSATISRTAQRWLVSFTVEVDRAIPHPGCGYVKAKLALAERIYHCKRCGLVLDRDINAARNLLNLAASGAERLNACGGMIGPGEAGRIPLNQEPGTAPAGKTGTAAGQPAAAG
jgi:transposase